MKAKDVMISSMCSALKDQSLQINDLLLQQKSGGALLKQMDECLILLDHRDSEIIGKDFLIQGDL